MNFSRALKKKNPSRRTTGKRDGYLRYKQAAREGASRGEHENALFVTIREQVHRVQLVCRLYDGIRRVFIVVLFVGRQ